MTNIGSDCFGDNLPTNPKTDLWQRGFATRPMSLFSIEQPILTESNDTVELSDFFKKWPFVPYAGTSFHSSHTVLDFYAMLQKLSPTHGACINKKTTYSTGGRVKIVRSLDPVWSIFDEVTDLPLADKIAYRDSVNKFFVFKGGLQALCKNVSDKYQAFGESYVELSYSIVEGETRISIKSHNERHVLPGKTDTSYPIYGVSEIWSDEHLRKYPPRLISGYPEFTQDVTGVMSTMFFLKDGIGGHHGRPSSENSDIYKYREVQDSIYLTKQSAGNFSGQLIIEVEDGEASDAIDNSGAQAAGFSDFSAQFQENFTMKSNQPQSVLLVSRPPGAKEMFVFQVAPNTSQEWYHVTGLDAINHITTSHGVTPRFLGKESANGFSENAYLMDYLTNVEPTVNALREVVMDFVNSIINAGWDILSMQEMQENSITFDNPIQSMIDAYNVQQTGAVNVPKQNKI